MPRDAATVGTDSTPPLERRFHLDATVVRPPESGVQRAVREQVLSLLTTDLGPQCVLYAIAPDLLDAAIRAGAEVHPLPRLLQRPVLRILWQQTILPWRLHRRGSLDVLYAPAYTAPLHCRARLVVNLHDVIALTHPELCSLRNRLHMRLLIPPTVRRAHRIIVSTRVVARCATAMFGVPQERLAVIPLGVRTDVFGMARPLPERLRPHLTPGEYLLFVGNIEPKKGVDVLLDAYALCADDLAMPLVLAGQFAWRSRSVRGRIERYRGPGRVVFVGRVSDTELAALYANAWAFVFPSRVEGFGLPVLEAMAAGAPVVHSDAPAVQEVAGEAGLEFTRDAPESLARALHRLAASPTLRAELAARGKKRAALFSWERWGAEAGRVLKEAAAKDCGGR